MLFDNPIFADWYTDTVDVYRTEEKKDGSITRQVRVKGARKANNAQILQNKRICRFATGTL